MNLVSSKQEELGKFECGPTERILYAGLRTGLPLPHECATGTCGTCRAKLLSGEVEDLWAEAPGRKALRTGKGEILLCQSLPRGDCSVGIRMPRPAAGESQPIPSYFTGNVQRSGMLTHDVLILELSLDRPMQFLAGQFVLVEVPEVAGFRAYSMVNFSHSTERLELIVKRKPGGVLSNVLFGPRLSSLTFKVFGPLGTATLEPDEGGAGDLVCVAGGTGIAGIMAILARASESGYLDHHNAVVCFGVRGLADLFFLDRFSGLKRKHPETLKVVVATSEQGVGSAIREMHPEIEFKNGFVHEALAWQELGNFANVIAYAAGPPPAVEAATSVLLTKHRVPVNRIRFDKFG
ncbi:2Fe-2S iron-sulfur cluster-binding protein [Caenimonas soli]|uniref:2Fe-2S iron-sulfur cluster-binding protein n=1 Tax=Caenimonas soli TaxID=2735555 RepID=UPI001551C073|nr:2Fe-2S iron-sulfur cluster binding domain-containing protein [Caenimonas soli]NPC59134.1 2Fe-2S iron-sulfur cluster binding domain-containing protein [Caenimonas soli]